MILGDSNKKEDKLSRDDIKALKKDTLSSSQEDNEDLNVDEDLGPSRDGIKSLSKDREKKNLETEMISLDRPNNLEEILKDFSPMKVEMACIEKEELDTLSDSDKETIESYKVEKEVVEQTFKHLEENSLYVDVEALNKDRKEKKVELEEKSVELVNKSYADTICSLPDDTILEFESRCLEYITIFEDLFSRNTTTHEKMYQYLCFCLKREFRSNLLILKPSGDKVDLVFNGFEFTKSNNVEVSKYIADILNKKDFGAEAQITSSKLNKYEVEYYYPCYGQDTETISYLFVFSQKHINNKLTYLNLFLNLTGVIVIDEALKE